MEQYLEKGPSFIFLYHPALGPLWDIIAQKVRGGALKHGSELVLEVRSQYLLRTLSLPAWSFFSPAQCGIKRLLTLTRVVFSRRLRMRPCWTFAWRAASWCMRTASPAAWSRCTRPARRAAATPQTSMSATPTAARPSTPPSSWRRAMAPRMCSCTWQQRWGRAVASHRGPAQAAWCPSRAPAAPRASASSSATGAHAQASHYCLYFSFSRWILPEGRRCRGTLDRQP